jgi:pyruvate kinase
MDADDYDMQQRNAVKAARECGLVRKGDLIAVVAASPGPRAGSTDVVHVVRA